MEPDLCPWEEPIILTAASCKLEELRQELSKQKDVDTRDQEFQRTPLHWAVQGGHDSAVDLLLAHDADVNAAEPHHGITPLLEAVAGGHLSIVRLLIDAGARIETPDMLGDTPLILAVRQRNASMVRLLLENGAGPNVRDWRRGMTPLSLASEEGHGDMVDLLLHYEASAKIANDEGKIPLEHALKNYHDNIAQTLAANMARRESNIGEDGEQIIAAMRAQIHEEKPDPYRGLDDDATLLLASKERDQDMIKGILDKDVFTDVDIKDEDGRTPLSHAAGGGDTAVAIMLLDKGADVNSVDSTQWTPLMVAAERGLEEMSSLLLQRGALPDAQNEDGFTPLILAASSGSVGLVSKLLDAGADPNAQDESENLTAISRAVENDDVAMVDLFLGRGISPNVDDRTLLCALHNRDRSESIDSEGFKLIESLVKHGIDVFMDGWTDERPIVIAAYLGLESIVALFLQAEYTSSEIRQKHIENAICVAAEEGEKKILRMLMEHYIRRDPNEETETPWEWAKSNEFGYSVKLLRPFF